MREFDDLDDGGPDLGVLLVRRAVTLVALGRRVHLDVLRRRLENCGERHAEHARAFEVDSDFGELGEAMTPGLLSVLDRLEVGDVARADRRLWAVLRFHAGIRRQPWPVATRMVESVRLAALLPVGDQFVHAAFTDDCPCGPELDERAGWHVTRHHELMPAQSWEAREAVVTMDREDDQ